MASLDFHTFKSVQAIAQERAQIQMATGARGVGLLEADGVIKGRVIAGRQRGRLAATLVATGGLLTSTPAVRFRPGRR